jgi:exonuclease V
MLYHRLLTSLLTRPSSPPSDPSPAPTPFAWTRLYTHLSLSPSTQFTATFIDSIQPILVGSSLETTLGSARTLEDFVAVLQGYGDTLGAKDGNGPFGDELEISYVMRETTRKWKPRRKTRKEREEEDVAKAIAESLNAVTVGGGVTEEDEEEELARALAMSLEEGRAGPQENGAGGGSQSQVTVDEGATMDEIDSQQEALPFFLDPSLLTATPNGAEVSPAPSFDPLDLPSNSQASPTELDIPVNPRYSLRRRRHPSADITSEAIDVAASPVKRSRSSPAKADLPSTRPAPPPVPAPSAPSSPEDVSEGTWIGTEKFKNNPEELSSWLEDVTRLWMGERPPRGVSMEQTSRCRYVLLVYPFSAPAFTLCCFAGRASLKMVASGGR